MIFDAAQCFQTTISFLTKYLKSIELINLSELKKETDRISADFFLENLRKFVRKLKVWNKIVNDLLFSGNELYFAFISAL